MNIKEYMFDRCANLVVTDMTGKILRAEGHLKIDADRWGSWIAPHVSEISGSAMTEWEIAEKADEYYFNVKSFVFDRSSGNLPFEDEPLYPDRFMVHMIYDVSSYAALFKELSEYSAELVRLRKQIEYESEHDSLTDLYNRGKYSELARVTFKNYRSIAVYNLDVNYLKRTNDELGHEAGNRLLTKAAGSIKAVIGDSSYGFRMGGDEFLIVSGDIDRTAAEELRNRWVQALMDINAGDPEPECVVACGMAYADAPYDLRTVMDEADKLMYADKRAIKISRGDDPDAR